MLKNFLTRFVAEDLREDANGAMSELFASLQFEMAKEKGCVEYINARIKQEVCYETLEELTDAKLMCQYKDCKSVKNEIKKLSDVLGKYIDEEIKQKIIQEYLLQLIPAGTKGVIRGNKFNNIVKQFITKLALDTDRFEICFEKKCEGHITTEIPDWYILEKSTNKIIIGMNQLDLWGGGQQLNRGSKYINIITKLVSYYVLFVMKYNLKEKIKHTNYLKLVLKIIHYVI